MAEIGFGITDSITYLIRQSVRERIRSGKNVFNLRNLLSDIDKKITLAKNTPRKKLAILFGENEEEYKIARAKFGQFGGNQEFEPVAVCSALNGGKYRIPLNLMFKPDIMEFGMSIGKPKHPFIQKNIETTAAIRQFYIGEVDFTVSKISEEAFLNDFKAVYDCKTQELVES
jgi:D-alanine-D-alanine ligase